MNSRNSGNYGNSWNSRNSGICTDFQGSFGIPRIPRFSRIHLPEFWNSKNSKNSWNYYHSMKPRILGIPRIVQVPHVHRTQKKARRAANPTPIPTEAQSAEMFLRQELSLLGIAKDTRNSKGPEVPGRRNFDGFPTIPGMSFESHGNPNESINFQ